MMGGVRQSVLLGTAVLVLCGLAFLPFLEEPAMSRVLHMAATIASLCLLLIALRFRNLRVVLASLSILMIALLLRFLAVNQGLATWIATLTVINLAFVSTVDDPGFDWEVAGLWTAWLGVEGAVLAGIHFSQPEQLEGMRLGALYGVDVHASIVLCVAAMVVLFVVSIVNRDPILSGLFWGAVPLIVLHARPAKMVTALLISLIAVAISLMERSYWIAYFDELTGLRGRRALNETLQVLSPPYCVAVVDVDHFKSFNDTYGHDIGDQVLRKVAAKLARVGGGGRAFRCGGEEFLVLFRGRPIKHALEQVERLRRAIEQDVFHVRGLQRSKRKREERRRMFKPSRNRATEACKVTVSIGLAEAAEDLTPQQVYKAADRALYRAKDAGRNRTEVARRAANSGPASLVPDQA